MKHFDVTKLHSRNAAPQRRLASIRFVSALKPIPKADNIEVAMIDGWEIVVKKGEFQVGDLCVYFEIDSFLPIEERYEFLRKSSLRTLDGVDGFRLKTIKLRGQISQGLALPLSAFPKTMAGRGADGRDVTEFLKVKKWELPEKGPRVPGMGAANKRGFPSWIRKTDQERIQNCFRQIIGTDKEFEVTLKLDGSSMTVYHRDGRVGVCSRNVDLVERERNWFWTAFRRVGEIVRLSDATLDRLELKAADLWSAYFKGQMPGIVEQHDRFWKVARKLGLIEALQKSGRNVAIQGELMGPGIQGNREGLLEHDFYLFDIWDIDRQCYLEPYDRADFQDEYLPVIHHVPVHCITDLAQFSSVQDFLNFAKQRSLYHPVAEGFVFKSMDGQTSFKVINNEYLLKEAESLELEQAA